MDVERLTLHELERVWHRGRTRRLWLLAPDWGGGRYFVTDGRGRTIATAAEPGGDWVPVPESLEDARAIIREEREFCYERHDGPGSHTSACSLALYGGYTWAEFRR